MDLKNIIVEQIKLTKHEEEVREAEAKKQAEEEKQRKAAETEIKKAKEEKQVKIEERRRIKEFNSQKKMFEKFGVKKIVECIVCGLNNKDEQFIPLRNIMLDKVNRYRTSDSENMVFSIREPSGIIDNYRYCLFVDDDNADPFIQFLPSEDNVIAILLHGKKQIILSSNNELAAQQVVNFLMTV